MTLLFFKKKKEFSYKTCEWMIMSIPNLGMTDVFVVHMKLKENQFHLSITISQLYILFSIFPVLLDFKYIFVLEIMCVLWQSNVILKRRKGLFWPKVQISCYYDNTLKNVTLKYTRSSPRTCVSVVFCPVNLLCFMITAYCP